MNCQWESQPGKLSIGRREGGGERAAGERKTCINYGLLDFVEEKCMYKLGKGEGRD